MANNGTTLWCAQCVQSVSAGELPLPVILFADTEAAAAAVDVQLFAACPVLLMLLPPSDTIALTTLDKGKEEEEKRLRSRRSSSG